MPHTVSPDQLRPHQIVNVIRNGVALRCKVMHACRDCGQLVFRHILRSSPDLVEATPEAVAKSLTLAHMKTSEVIGWRAPREARNDSGFEWHGPQPIEVKDMTLVCRAVESQVFLLGSPVEIELLADPRCN